MRSFQLVRSDHLLDMCSYVMSMTTKVDICRWPNKLVGMSFLLGIVSTYAHACQQSCLSFLQFLFLAEFLLCSLHDPCAVLDCLAVLYLLV